MTYIRIILFEANIAIFYCRGKKGFWWNEKSWYDTFIHYSSLWIHSVQRWNLDLFSDFLTCTCILAPLLHFGVVYFLLLNGVDLPTILSKITNEWLCLAAQSCPTLCDPMDCSLPGSSVHGDSPGKNTGVGSLSLLKGIFPTQASNPGLPHCRWILYHLSHQRSPRILECVSYLFSRGFSCPRNWPRVSCIADGFFTSWATND